MEEATPDSPSRVWPEDRVFKEESLWLEAEAWLHTQKAYG